MRNPSPDNQHRCFYVQLFPRLAPVRVALYARVSTDEQNIDQQRDLLVRYCKERDWQYRSFMDAAMKGSMSDGPGWQDLLREAEKDGFDAIVVVKTDRITRSLEYAVWFYDWLIAHPTIKLVSIYDSMDLQTPDGYFTLMLNCLLSEREILINKWRSRIGIERAKKEGKYRGGRDRPWLKS